MQETINIDSYMQHSPGCTWIKLKEHLIAREREMWKVQGGLWGPGEGNSLVMGMPEEAVSFGGRRGHSNNTFQPGRSRAPANLKLRCGLLFWRCGLFC